METLTTHIYLSKMNLVCDNTTHSTPHGMNEEWFTKFATIDLVNKGEAGAGRAKKLVHVGAAVYSYLNQEIWRKRRPFKKNIYIYKW